MTDATGAEPAVQATAYLAAACRAADAARGGRLQDPYAARFAAAQPAGQPAYRTLLDAGGAEVVARTLLVDALVRDCLTHGPAPVVVNLGAGFCTRPYRLDLSAAVQVVELDAAPVLAVKDDLLAGETASVPVVRTPVDVRDRGALAEALGVHCRGADRVVVVSEGLLPYLPPADVSALAHTLSGALPGTAHPPSWLTDVVSQGSARAMAQLARTAGAEVVLHGLATLAPLEEAGWVPADYRILPTPRRGPPGSYGGRAGAGPASAQVVDGVVALRRDVRP